VTVTQLTKIVLS